jgi:hypothetical protein
MKMKFLNSFLSLLLVSTVALAVSLNHVQARDEDLYLYTKECKAKLEKYEKCYSYDIRGDSNSIDCEISNSEICQEFYSSKISGIPECQKDDKILLEYIDYILELYIASVQLECSKNEFNEYCPLAQLERNDTISNKDYVKEYDQAVTETCKSRMCIDSFMDSYLRLKEAYEKSENFFSDLETMSPALMLNIDKKKLISKFIKTSNKIKRDFKSNVNSNDVENIDTYLSLLNETSVYLDSQECMDQMVSNGLNTIPSSLKHTLYISMLLLFISALI